LTTILIILTTIRGDLYTDGIDLVDAFMSYFIFSFTNVEHCKFHVDVAFFDRVLEISLLCAATLLVDNS
jgi:hypothetical protein